VPLDPLKYSDPIVRVYEACVDELLVNLAKHFNVSAIGNTPSFNYEVEMLSKLGAVRKETAAIIARYVAENEPMIEEAVKTAMLDALEEVEPELRQAATEGLLHDADMEVMDGIQSQLTAYSRQARNQLNLVNTVMLASTADAYRKGVYAAVDIVKQMQAAQGVLNAETGKVITGVSTPQQALRAAVRAMSDAGIRGFVDSKGRNWSAEAYVRMAIKTTVSNSANAAVMARNEQYGNDIVWPRVNATARPGCYPWQGQLISMSNRERDVPDGNGKMRHVYAVSQTTYGQPAGIWGINCHHGPMNVFIPGFSYVRGEDVKPDKSENDRLYALTQEQRRLERQVRYAKRDAAMYNAAGDRQAFERAALKVKDANARLKNFVNSHDSLVFSGEKVYTFGYNRSVSGKVNLLKTKGQESLSINAPIEQRNTGKGNPSAITMVGRPLNNRQKRLLEQLPSFNSRIVVPKKNVNARDLAALTAETGDEFALFTRKNERIVLRGTSKMTDVSPEKAEEMAKDGWRWSAHTHPGYTEFCMIASDGDIAILEAFGQVRSLILNSMGDLSVFGLEE